MENEKKILNYIGGRGWTWIAGLVLMAAGILIIGLTDSVLILLAIVLVFVGAYYLLRALTVDLPAVRRGKKSLAQLQAAGKLELSAAELSAADSKVIGRDRAILAEHFLFGYQNGAAFAYSDLLWVYKRRYTQRVMGLPVKTVESLIVSTASQREVCAVNLGGRDKKNELDAAIAHIQNRNPNILLGYTKENKQACKELSQK